MFKHIQNPSKCELERNDWLIEPLLILKRIDCLKKIKNKKIYLRYYGHYVITRVAIDSWFCLSKSTHFNYLYKKIATYSPYIILFFHTTQIFWTIAILNAQIYLFIFQYLEIWTTQINSIIVPIIAQINSLPIIILWWILP